MLLNSETILLKETNNYRWFVDNEKIYQGCLAGVVAAAAETAKEAGLEGKWVFTLHNPSVMPFLQYADNRNLREQIYRAYTNRGNNNNEYDNKEVISKLIALKTEKANLLGFPDYASYVLDENMAKNPENVYSLCNQIWEAALKVAKKEAATLQKMINKTDGSFQLQPWDWRYYAEKVKQAQYGLDENELRQYFPLEQVREGAFYTAHKLYGITFEPRTDLPLPHPGSQRHRIERCRRELYRNLLCRLFSPSQQKSRGLDGRFPLPIFFTGIDSRYYQCM